ncbi:MAG: hydrogenase expression/formation protein HypE [Candidatus Fraserbacteria bacterium RBG_16_55_9]|uniref:Hydrogenase expression/formation protein HypE n=1 Tax=Fraserbacteria sp. (strain RBG_16_55_9) TaxID=1817864 RepID=A0A1F5UW22_FRAXR|nr:MAG: hydrogenase expression/formation protein HypE [Candidatus Fraserbacteria bacterium RBG_16_55_9]
MTDTRDFMLSCPIPISEHPHVLLAHGGGGKLMQQLIEKLIGPAFKNPYLDERHDGAVIKLNGAKLAFTTDSYVVHPLFFPGGDIGELAVNGTVNDLAMCGARPLFLSVALILEEGLPMETLWRVVRSMQQAAAQAGVQLVTGDTKVVDKGKGDGIFINTAGIGGIEHDAAISPRSVKPGDLILLNGDVGRHGIAIMAVREGLSFESEIESDCAPLAHLVLRLLDEGIEVHCLRDLTRGGLSSALNEIAQTASVGVAIDERRIPVRQDVQGACEILGLDPLYVANEGRFIAFVAPSDGERALQIMQSDPLGQDACLIGEVLGEPEGVVMLKSQIGANRILDMLSGEQLPRIC